jgi:hypothetical protein
VGGTMLADYPGTPTPRLQKLGLADPGQRRAKPLRTCSRSGLAATLARRLARTRGVWRRGHLIMAFAVRRGSALPLPTASGGHTDGAAAFA